MRPGKVSKLRQTSQAAFAASSFSSWLKLHNRICGFYICWKFHLFHSQNKIESDFVFCEILCKTTFLSSSASVWVILSWSQRSSEQHCEIPIYKSAAKRCETLLSRLQCGHEHSVSHQKVISPIVWHTQCSDRWTVVLDTHCRSLVSQTFEYKYK